MTVPVVRWMSAFRNRRVSLAQALRHELTQYDCAVVAAEPIWSRSRLHRSECLIGLVVDQANSELVRAYAHDCYSEGSTLESLIVLNPQGKPCTTWDELRALGRDRNDSAHGECLVRHVRYSMIIVGRKASHKDFLTALEIGQEFSIPVRSERTGEIFR